MRSGATTPQHSQARPAPRRPYARAAVRGAAIGIAVGLLFTLCFALVGLAEPLEHGIVLPAYGALAGAALGAAAGVLRESLR